MIVDKNIQNTNTVYTISNELGDKVLIIEKANENDSIVFNLTGRLDTHTAPEVQNIVCENIDNNKNMHIILNFSGVKYMSSAGLRAMLYIQKKVNTLESSDMKIIKVTPEVMEIFDMTDFREVLNIQETNQEL